MRAASSSLSAARLLVLPALVASVTSCKSAGEPAPPPPAGHVFLTFADEDTSRTMSVRYVSGVPLDEPALEVKAATDAAVKGLTVTTTSRDVFGRHLYAFDLAHLEPGARYRFVVKDGARALTKERAFETLPADDGPVVLATGGDLGIDEGARKLLAAAAASSPDVLALGGDLAYANGEPKAAPRWDVFLQNLDEHLVTSDGRTIPVVFAIGNHEVRGSFLRPPTNAPFWYGFLSDVRDEDLAHETSFVRSLGPNASLVVLDTSHVQPHAAQARFLDDALQKAQEKPFRFALYHVPLYPSVRDYDKKPSDEGRVHWMPLFDRHDLTAAFENHDHALKRTPPLEGGVPSAGGTLYLGDGCMGQSERPVLQQGAPYLAKAATDSHFWLVEVSKDNVRYRALDEEGRTLDETSTSARPAAAAMTGAPASSVILPAAAR